MNPFKMHVHNLTRLVRELADEALAGMGGPPCPELSDPRLLRRVQWVLLGLAVVMSLLCGAVVGALVLVGLL